MNKRATKINESTDKGYAIKNPRDHGDNSKKLKMTVEKNAADSVEPNLNTKENLLDRGDTQKLCKEKYINKNVHTKTNRAVEVNPKCIDEASNSHANVVNKHYIRGKTTNDLGQTTRQNTLIVDKSNVKSRLSLNSKIVSKQSNLSKKDINKSMSGITNVEKDSSINPSTSLVKQKPILTEIIIPYNLNETTKDCGTGDDLIAQRKPIVKTITSRYDPAKAYKAVSFKDQRLNRVKPLQITIPNIVKHEKAVNMNSKTKFAASKTSVKKSRKISERHRGKRNNRSPSLVKCDTDVYPPTEVAKWAPSCLDSHTRPYYEAWVDTTLTAISRSSTKHKLLLNEQNLLKRLYEFNRPQSHELTYANFADERYTGKIKVTHK